MAKPEKNRTDQSTRASTAGHEYHEMWAARVSLELLKPSSDLKAISLEGFPVQDAKGLSGEAMEIADMVKLYGGSSVKRASRICIQQLKYSVTRENIPLTASDLAGTLKKFVATQKDLEKILGKKKAGEVTYFEFVSNRSIGSNLSQAITALKAGGNANGNVGKQLKTLKESITLKGTELTAFLERLAIVGEGGSLSGINYDLQRTMADWSGASDLTTRLKLLELCNHIRGKAGVKGTFYNTITDVDVLGALGVDDIEDILPTPHSFPQVKVVLERPFIEELETSLLSSSRPLIAHGGGGCGKTVVMQSIAKRLSENHITILFDGFGGGKWRAPGDDRHLCNRSLRHIVNSLAADGLCEPVLPGGDEGQLLRTAAKRLEQARDNARRFRPGSNIILLLDAIDHAGEQAEATKKDSFAKLLLKRLDIDPIEGVKIIASCRTERRKKAYGTEDYPEFKIPAFSKQEVKELAQKRLPDITNDEISILRARSGGNPRCLDMLLTDGRPFHDHQVDKGNDLLDVLIEKHFNLAIDYAVKKGTDKQAAHALISAFRRLPPPVPTGEMALLFDLDISEVESFFSDLFPMIDRSEKGLIFKDEPTETLAKKFADKDPKFNAGLFARLQALQSDSAYAARALPSLLLEFGQTDELLDLAFSDVFPEEASSTVAKRNIRLARISAAMSGCAQAKRNDDLFRLMMEAAYVSSGNLRSDRYVHDNPDLAAISGDPEALRRLYEVKVSWPGALNSSRAIASILSGNFEDARRETRQAIDWLNWKVKQPQKDDFGPQQDRPTDKDWIGAIYGLFLNGEADNVIEWLDNRHPDRAYDFFAKLLDLAVRHAKSSKLASDCIEWLVQQALKGEIAEPWCLASLLTQLRLPKHQERTLIRKLSSRIEKYERDQSTGYGERHRVTLTEALLTVVAKSIALNMRKEARAILECVSVKRPDAYAFNDRYNLFSLRIPGWLNFAVLNATLLNRKPNVSDLVPTEIYDALSPSLLKRGPKAIERAIERMLADPYGHSSHGRKAPKRPKIPPRERDEISRAYRHRAKPLLAYANLIQEVVTRRNGRIDLAAHIEMFEKDVLAQSSYPYRDQSAFVAEAGFRSILFVANATGSWTEESSDVAVKWLKGSPLYLPVLLEVVYDFARQPSAGRAAIELGYHAADIIRKDTSVEGIIDQLGELARSIWHASEAEAALLFKQALDQADAIGSDDYDEIQSLVHVLSEYSGELLSPETVYDFSKICERVIPDDTEKFIWSGYANALSRTGGTGTLSIISRLADRGAADAGDVDLFYTLPPLLTALVKDNHLEPELAAAMIGLDHIVEFYYQWDMHKFAEAVLPSLPAEQQNNVVGWITVDFDRSYQDSASNISFSKLLDLYRSLSIPQEAIAHFEAIERRMEEEKAARGDSERDHVAYRSSGKSEKPRRVAFDVTDAEALAKDIQKEIGNDQTSYAAYRRLKHIATKIRDLDQLIAFVKAIAELEGVDLDEKLSTFKFVLDTWGDASRALRDAMKNEVDTLILMHADELVGGDWSVGSRLRDLFQLAPVDKRKILSKLIRSLGGDLEDMGGHDWMRFASHFVSVIDQDVVATAITRYIHLRKEDPQEDHGGSPWSNKLLPPSSNVENVAGLIWQQLGSPSAELRWRAAHAILRLAKVDRFDVIEKLIGKLDREDAAPFNNTDLPFYFLHARLWLTMVMTRLSREAPARLVMARPAFERSLKRNRDHAAISYHLALILERLERFEKRKGCEKRIEKYRSLRGPVSTSPKPQNFFRRGEYGGRPDGVPEPDFKFNLDHDFRKMEVDGLGRLFNVDTWKVEDDIAAVVSSWGAPVARMYDCPRNIGADLSNRGDQKYNHGYGFYLGYHALLTVAGKYLQQNPILEDDWEENPWEGWIHGYVLGGPWLSEMTDLFPADVPSHAVSFDEQSLKTTTAERKELAALCGFANDGLGERLIVGGDWPGGQGDNISVVTVLADPGSVKDIVNTVFGQRATFQYLPTREDLHVGPDFDYPTEKWICEKEQMWERIDETDPYGYARVLSKPFPCGEAVQVLQISKTDQFGRVWSDGSGVPVMTSRAWGVLTGSRRYAKEEGGDWLQIEREPLLKLLRDKKAALVVLVRGRKYHEKRETSGVFVEKSAVVTVSSAGAVRVVQRIPERIRKIIKALPYGDGESFETIYKAIR